jgi:glycerophosphoryl diester phosphodiesterase
MLMRRVFRIAGFMLAGFILFVTVNNASVLAPTPTSNGLLIAHRGVHQDFTTEGLTNDSCTARMIYPPEHEFLENTLPSIAEAFRLGADAVEIDVHPTTDGQFAVFHDWTVDCRTDGTGLTREQSMEYLKTLDIGYGYTADGGRTFPFRGKGVGLMPTLDEVLTAFPDKHFAINVKSNDAQEGVLLAARLLRMTPEERTRISIVAMGDRPYRELRQRLPETHIGNRTAGRECLLDYITWGWSGHVPQACRNGSFVVPRNYSWVMWGYPNRLHARMTAAGIPVTIIPSYRGGVADTTIDDPVELALVPPGYGIWTNRIERIGPAAGR